MKIAAIIYTLIAVTLVVLMVARPYVEVANATPVEASTTSTEPSSTINNTTRAND